MELDSNGVSIEQPIIQQDNYESYFRDEIEKYKNTVNYKPKYAYEFFRRLVDIIFSLVALIPAVILILIFQLLLELIQKDILFFHK